MSKNKTHIRHCTLFNNCSIMYCGKTIDNTEKVNSILKKQLFHVKNKKTICFSCLKLFHVKNKKTICFSCLKQIYGTAFVTNLRQEL